MALRAVSLDDKYLAESGRVYLTGIQALVRLPISQKIRDRAAGLDTAGLISGYRGSPLGGYDQELWRARRHLERHNVRFQPGLNEELAATALWGSQQIGLFGKPKYDGVFGIWYGKNPGLDRSGDALKHANAAGAARHGGVLVVVGDDHAAKSSDLPNQCDYTLMGHMMPVLYPSDIQDVLDFGLYGWALSRFSGCWVGFKVQPNLMDRSASVEVEPGRVDIRLPADFAPGGGNIRWPDNRFAQEERLLDFKLRAVPAFVRANGLDRREFDGPARFGIVTAGKSYSDVREALEELGIDEERARALGLRLYKLAMSWPLEPQGARAFADGLQEVLVVEEKQPVIQDQLRTLLYHLPDSRRPRVVGKTDEEGRPLLSPKLELDPVDIACVIARRLLKLRPDEALQQRLDAIERRRRAAVVEATSAVRAPYFCSGCPHNSSLKRPSGSRALAGIGCHWMAVWVPEFATEPSTQMGGEGANWIGQAPFTETEHVFQNLGDGTYFHSGLLAVRAAVAAGVNITYKILYNDAVAMTGGQPVEGQPTVGAITHQLRAEGVQRIVVVTDEPDKYGASADFAAGVTVHHRDALLEVQRELRQCKGVSALVYDQTCAAEKRRRRKRNQFPDPPKRVFINDLVCEGCGDCSVQSNCISIEPLETELGRKRTINQSSCNKDFSCINGFCPSFVTVHNASLRKQAAGNLASVDASSLPEPATSPLESPYNIVVTGIGGTGVVTIGALLGMAAHLEGKGCSVLDSIGLAQKNGAVVSHIRISGAPDQLHSARIPTASANCLLACDIVVAASAEVLTALGADRTKAIVNEHVVPTAAFVLAPDLDFDVPGLKRRLDLAIGRGRAEFVDAHRLATSLLGDAIAMNVFMLGFAFQRGLLPVGREALERAIELNGVAAEMNRSAFAWGRMAAHRIDSIERLAGARMPVRKTQPRTLDELVAARMRFLTGYQNEAYAARYRALVDDVRHAEQARAPGLSRLSAAVASGYFKLLAYKDEYEVARLYTDGDFQRKLQATFEDGFALEFHLAPPILARRDPETGEAKKRTFGPWMFRAFRLLAKLRGLRGTAFDPFGYQAERRLERKLIADYETVIRELIDALSTANYDLATRIALIPEQIRGYGHVKEKNLRTAKDLESRLLLEVRSGAQPAKVA